MHIIRHKTVKVALGLPLAFAVSAGTGVAATTADLALTHRAAAAATWSPARTGASVLTPIRTAAAEPGPDRLKDALLTTGDLPEGYVPMPDALKAFSGTGSMVGACDRTPGSAARPAPPDRPVAPGAPAGPDRPVAPGAPVGPGLPVHPSPHVAAAPAPPRPAEHLVAPLPIRPARHLVAPLPHQSAGQPVAPPHQSAGQPVAPLPHQPAAHRVVPPPHEPAGQPVASPGRPGDATPKPATPKPAGHDKKSGTVRVAFMRGDTGPILIEAINPVGDRAARNVVGVVADAPRRCPTYDEGKPGSPDALHMATFPLGVPRFGDKSAGVRFAVDLNSPRVTVHGKMVAVSVRGVVLTVLLADLEVPGQHELEAITRTAVQKIKRQK